MRNKLKTFLYFCLISFFLISEARLNELNFEAKNINSQSNEIITASDEVIVTDHLGNKIFADKLEIDNKKRIYTIYDNVVYKDFSNSINIKANKIIFYELENTFKSIGSTQINKDNQYFIKSSVGVYINIYCISNIHPYNIVFININPYFHY